MRAGDEAAPELRSAIAGASASMSASRSSRASTSRRLRNNIAAFCRGFSLGVTAAADASDMGRAVGAARRAFDETDWPTNGELRRRCLAQLQSAIEAEKEDLREELIAEVGCPAMTTQSAQLDWPLAESLRYPARLIDDFDWERTLDGGGLFGERKPAGFGFSDTVATSDIVTRRPEGVSSRRF